jgi:hypothetical protein
MVKDAGQSLKAAFLVDQMVRGAAIDSDLHLAARDLIDPIVQLVNFHQVISHKSGLKMGRKADQSDRPRRAAPRERSIEGPMVFDRNTSIARPLGIGKANCAETFARRGKIGLVVLVRKRDRIRDHVDDPIQCVAHAASACHHLSCW